MRIRARAGVTATATATVAAKATAATATAAAATPAAATTPAAAITTATAIATAAVLALSLAGCGGQSSNDPAEPIGKDVVAPVTMSVNELQGETVELVTGQVLNIDTDDLAVDSYSGEVSDPAVAEFTPGRSDGDAEFNPGVTALGPGSSEVTMTNEQGGIQPLTFTVEVSSLE